MASLRERMEEVIRDGLVADATAWSRAAGLNKGHVTTILARLEGRPDSEQHLDRITLEALAGGAKVSAGWLAFGDGPRQKERFPNRATALMFARARKANEAALREIETAPEWQKSDYVTRGVEWWGDEIVAAEARHKLAAAQSLIRESLPSSQPPAPATPAVAKRKRAG